jgi:hypothetical protein
MHNASVHLHAPAPAVQTIPPETPAPLAPLAPLVTHVTHVTHVTLVTLVTHLSRGIRPEQALEAITPLPRRLSAKAPPSPSLPARAGRVPRLHPQPYHYRNSPSGPPPV